MSFFVFSEIFEAINVFLLFFPFLISCIPKRNHWIQNWTSGEGISYGDGMKHRIQDYPEEERPRERLQSRGARALSILELLAILIRTGRSGTSALDLAQQLLDRFGSLEGISRASIASLASLPGIGGSKASQILAAFELGIRLQQSPSRRFAMRTAQDIWKWFRAEMIQLPHESIRVMVLNTRRELVAVEEVTKGILNEVLFHPREIFQPAIFHQGCAIVVVHNHPSGDPSPSAADRKMTRQILEVGKILEIPLLDHVIIGKADDQSPNAYYSFQEQGEIF